MYRNQSAPRGRGGRGRRPDQQRRDEGRQQQRQIDDEEQDQPQRERERATHSRQPRQERPVFKKTQKAEPDLAPKKISTEYTTEKNDPLLAEFAITDGVNGFLEVFQPREFQVDFSGLMVLLDSAYAAQTTADRSMAKYISRSMWNYYHIIMLWRKILTVRARVGEELAHRDSLYALIGEEFPCSSEIAAYLNGVGDFIDQDGARVKLAIQGRLTAARYFGASGSFGRVTDVNHYVYETLPSPLVALLRVRADLVHTNAIPAPENTLWDLPQGLRPLAVCGAGMPTAQMLGWRASERLTDTQRGVLGAAGFEAEDFGVNNIGNIPINELLMQSIAGYIRSSKTQCFKAPINTHIGSIAQVPFSEKILDEDDLRLPDEEQALPNANRLLCGKLMRTSTCTQFSIQIATASSTFRYRVKRSVRGPEGTANTDMLCYQFQAAPPAAWIGNANHVYEYGLGDNWNRLIFSMPEVSGIAMASRYCEEVRKKVTRK
nr:putative capsid protein [Zeya Brook partiti-like virus 1]